MNKIDKKSNSEVQKMLVDKERKALEMKTSFQQINVEPKGKSDYYTCIFEG